MKTSLLLLAAACIANAQNIAAQPKFEVASVKQSRCGGGSWIDPGVLTLRGMPLKGVLREAFNVKMEQIEGPSWLETECYDISAKIPAGVSRDQLSAMLRPLLVERFKLAAREEDRATSGYVLVVDKGGLKVKEDNAKAFFMGKDAKPGLTFYGVGAHGALKGVMTMTTLASNLSSNGYGPIQDATGLAGRYDIDLKWRPDLAVEAKRLDVTPSAEPPQVDTSLPDLFTAIRESLGLRLERRTVPVRFVVIDHIERIPTEN